MGFDEMEVQVESLTPQGEGIARPDGPVMFVPRALPGEQVRVEIVYRRKTDFVRAVPIEILTKSPDRVEPPCPHFEKCGGCQLQHLSDENQASHKTEQFTQTMQRMAGLDIENLQFHQNQTTGYRNRMIFRVTPTGAPRLALSHFADARKCIPIPNCLVLHAALNELIAPINQAMDQFCASPSPRPHRVVMRRLGDKVALAWVFAPGQIRNRKNLGKFIEGSLKVDAFHLFECANWKADSLASARKHLLFGKDDLKVKMGSCWAYAGIENFLQVNDSLAGEMYDWVSQLPYQSKQSIADIYCGVGLLTMGLAKRFGKVFGVDNDEGAVERARRTATAQGLLNMKFLCAPAEHLASGLKDFPEQVDAVILDPPRKGCSKAVLNAVLAMEPKDIVLISCHPAAMARDLRYLKENGWSPKEVSLWDLFPQSHHIEAAVHLTRG
jgi:23S rRNA (uracil1939-C5)-methyltransferase